MTVFVSHIFYQTAGAYIHVVNMTTFSDLFRLTSHERIAMHSLVPEVLALGTAGMRLRREIE